MINGSYVILLCKMLTDLTLIIKKLFLGFHFFLNNLDVVLTESKAVEITLKILQS